MQGFSFEVDRSARVAILRWDVPRPQMEVFRPGLAALLAHEGFRADFGVISDWRRIAEPPDSQFVKEFVAHLEGVSRRGRFVGPWATLVPKGSGAVYGMGRMTELLSETARFDYGVFTDYDDARSWILARLEHRPT